MAPVVSSAGLDDAALADALGAKVDVDIAVLLLLLAELVGSTSRLAIVVEAAGVYMALIGPGN